MLKSENRYDWADIAKGLGIFFDGDRHPLYPTMDFNDIIYCHI